MKFPAFPDPNKFQTYHITFTCYGTWLLGSEKGSTRHGGEYVAPNPALEKYMRENCNYSSVTLTRRLRRKVFFSLEKTCRNEGWTMQALNTLSQHVHAVVTVPLGVRGDVVLGKLKSEATQNLRASGFRQDQPIWTKSGDCKEVNTSGYFNRLIKYVLLEQTEPAFKSDKLTTQHNTAFPS